MRRADRLFQLVQLIRGRRLTTAEWLAARLEVSLRTVYRDVADLQHQGVPIDGEAGVGYRMRAGFDLPPLMFTTGQAKALVACVRLAQPRLDTALARDADDALSKILAVLPAAARAAAESLAVYAPALVSDDATRERLRVLREAAESRRFVQLDYDSLQGAVSQRRVRPLGVFYWDAVWTLGELVRTAARLSQLSASTASARCRRCRESFRDEAGKTLADLLRLVRAT